MSVALTVNPVKKEQGSPLTNHADGDSYQSVESPDNCKGDRVDGNPSYIEVSPNQVCVSSSDEDGLSKDSDDDRDAEDVSPWSEIISKYLRGTTKSQIVEYRKLLRPHTCDRSKCKFKRKYSEYRICRRHDRRMSECYRRPNRRSNGSAIQQSRNYAEMPNVEGNVMIVPTVVLPPKPSSIPITLAPRSGGAAAAVSVHSSASAMMNGLPYPPLYCHDSGLWSAPSIRAPAHHQFVAECGQLRSLNPDGHFQQAIHFAVPGPYQVKLSVAQPQPRQSGSRCAKSQCHPVASVINTIGNRTLQAHQNAFKSVVIKPQPCDGLVRDLGEENPSRNANEENLIEALFLRSSTPGPTSVSADHVSSNPLDAEERYQELVEAEKKRRRSLN